MATAWSLGGSTNKKGICYVEKLGKIKMATRDFAG